jgi:hypothetical protein
MPRLSEIKQLRHHMGCAGELEFVDKLLECLFT